MSIKIISVAKHLPKYVRKTKDIIPYVKNWVKGQEERFQRKVIKMFEGAGVDKRYSIMDIDDVMSDEQLLNIKMELDPFLKRTSGGQDNFTGFKTQRVGALIARSKTSRDLALNPMINEMAEKFLEHHCDNYQLCM